MYEDKVLICKDCGKEFVFTAAEQEFYAAKGFTNEPKRCKECREKRRNNAQASCKLYPAVCANCGKETQVPFQPHEGRLVYCKECFEKMRKK
ncbi:MULTISPECIES: zinc-ribbon domain containing protein [Caproicibacterium]|jgi:CxxC-x17-CxxC domain-containing protein|uniref:Zinc-binding protein n=1 Tax=Caproicibacterium lactatifermentans TaxID=2666138 RepID=A0A859DV82_9FIRM|nr:zinc-ribbon domain containing protein [Caproicibacterium lactatifermentans]ARP50336.1 zinc-binding protein [Ruminococcaceae bacterium CPB6]QKN23941.1 zinc-binding protein [Caproicibacterium lactatifermentans]QKO30987.1 zinc-binding protein [Caproicibacterium lactatifermentans]